MTELYDPPATSEAPLESKGPGETLRIVFITINLVVAVNILLKAALSGSHLMQHEGLLTILGMQLAVALMALVPTLFLWRRWRFRWALQATVGAIPLLLTAVGLYQRFFGSSFPVPGAS